MYFVITNRVVKFNTGATEKFAPRTSNNTIYTASGPFSPKQARQAAVAALSTHTCLEAQVLSLDQLRALKARYSSEVNYMLQQLAMEVLKRFEKPAVPA